MENSFTYFAMDEDKNTFVIFLIKRPDDVDVFLWVNPFEKLENFQNIKATTITGLYSYINHTCSPLFVLENNQTQEAVSAALEMLAECPNNVLTEKVKECLIELDEIEEDRPGWIEQIMKMEKDCYEAIDNLKADGESLWM